MKRSKTNFPLAEDVKRRISTLRFSSGWSFANEKEFELSGIMDTDGKETKPCEHLIDAGSQN